MSLRNRLVMSPMETMYGTPDGLPSERTRDYFAARAKGGVGLITVGATGIDPHHPETPGGLHLGTGAAVDAHRALVDVVHEHGAKIQPQIAAICSWARSWRRNATAAPTSTAATR